MLIHLLPGRYSRRTVTEMSVSLIVVPDGHHASARRAIEESVNRLRDSVAETVLVVRRNEAAAWGGGAAPSSAGPCIVVEAPPVEPWALRANRGAEAAHGACIVFVSDSPSGSVDWIERSRRVLDAAPQAGVVGPCLVTEGRKVRAAGLVLDHDGDPVPAFAEYPAERSEVAGVREVEAVPTEGIMLHRDLFQRLGGFDGRVGRSYEGPDLCLRCREAGLKVFCAGASQLTVGEGVNALPGPCTDSYRRTWSGRLDRLRLPDALIQARTFLYYQDPRADILDLVPESVMRVLDVGCAGGTLGMALRERRPGVRIWGIEVNAEVARVAARHLDHVWTGDAEGIDIPAETHFDCILLADVLEHLSDPWMLLRRLHSHLEPGGHVVASIPNLQHYSVVVDLLLGRWCYRAEGILDIDHLRFFTHRTIRSMFEQCGYTVADVRRNIKAGSPLRLLSWALLGGLDDFLTKKFYVLAQKRQENDRHGLPRDGLRI